MTMNCFRWWFCRLFWVLAGIPLPAQPNNPANELSATAEINTEANNTKAENIPQGSTPSVDSSMGLAPPQVALDNPEKQHVETTRETLLDNGKPLILQSIEIKVKGLSQKAILRNRIGVQEGQKFQNLSELRSILDIGFNKLKGTGYFKNDGVRYRLSREGEFIRLEAQFQDAWTIYPLAYPNYSTADGWGIRGRLKWDNFLGLLADVTLRLNWNEVPGGSYGSDLSGEVALSTIKISPNFGLNGSLAAERDTRKDGYNGKVGFGIGGALSIDTLRAHGISMEYSFSNSSSATFGYMGKITTRPHFLTSFSHKFSLDRKRLTWGGVFREGYNISLDNSYSFDSKVDPNHTPTLALEDIKLDFSIKLSRVYFGFINFKGRFGMGRSFDFTNGGYNSEGYNYDVNSYNRGKRKKSLTGNFIVFLNMDMAILVFRDRLLGALLLEPFLDVSWVHNADGFQLEKAALGSGFELIWIFHSLKLRFTFGFDLYEPEKSTISITTGFYF